MSNKLEKVSGKTIFLLFYIILICIEMIFKVATVPIIIMCIMTMIYIYIYPRYYIIFILICAEKYLFITESNVILSTSFDVVLILSIFISIRYFKFRGNNKRYFSNYIFITIGILFITIMIANIKFGQPINQCIIASRYMLLYIIYFPLSKLVDKYGSDYLLNTFMCVGFVIAILFLIQMIIYPKIIFKLNYSFRFGNVRSYASLIIISLSCLIAFSKFFYEDILKKKIFYISIVIINLFELILFSQTRSTIIILMLTLGFGLVTYSSKNKLTKIWMIIFVSAIIFVLFNEYFMTLFNSAFMEITNLEAAKIGTFDVRSRAIKFMLQQFKLSPIFGLGYYYGGYELSNYITGAAYGYYFGDVGVFGHIFHMGILGLITSILYYMKMFKIYSKLKNGTSKKLIFRLFLFFILSISSFNYFFAINNLIIYLIIFTCALEGTYNEEKNMKGFSNGRSIGFNFN